MTASQPAPVSPEPLRRISRLCAAAAIAIGLLVLTGWLLHVPVLMQVLPGQVAMVPNTAVGLLLAGVALWLRASRGGRSLLPASYAAAAVAGLLGFLNLVEYFSNRNLGIDELLFRDPAGLTSVFPGRMAVLTAVSFVALAAALLTADARWPPWASDGLALLPGVLAMVSLSGYTYGLRSLSWIGIQKGMAIHTALAFLALTIGVLLEHARGLSRLLVSDTAGGVVARRVLPVAFLAPFILGWLRVTGQERGLYGQELGRALYAVADALILIAILLATAAALMRVDEKRRSTEDALRTAEEQYRLLFENSPQPMWVVDRETLRYLAANDAAVDHYGYSRDEFLSMNIGQLRPAEDIATLKRAIPKEEAGLGKPGIWRHLKKDGTLINVDITTHTLKFEGRSAWLTLAYDVTDRVRAEEALRASEKRFRSHFELGLVGMSITSPAKGMIEVNDEICRILGYERHELLKKTWAELTHPDDLAADVTNFDRVMAGEVDGYSIDKRWIRKDGRIVDSSISVKCVRHDDGSVDYFVALVHDISERKRADEALLESERRFSLAFHSSPVPTSISEAGTDRILDVNEQFLGTFGYKRDEIVGRTSAELGLWAERADRDRIATGLDKGNVVRDTDVRIRTRAGELRDVAGSAVRVELGNVPCILSTFIDITERKRAEAALREREHHFRSLIENAQDLITIIDLEGVIRFQSPSAVRILGRPPEEFVGKGVFDFLHPDDVPGAHAALRHAATSPDSPRASLFRFRHANGSWRTMEGIGKVLPGDGAPQIVVNSRDVTESRTLEAQLRQAQKMDAVGRLAGGIAHDFNNLLTAIMGYTELATARLKPEDPSRADLSEIAKAAHRAADLTRQLLAFSRKQVLQPRVIDLNHVVSDTHKMLRRLIGEDIELVMSLKERLGSVSADTGQIEQVLVNLAVNSRDAMPKGGKLTIETSEVEFDEPYSMFHFNIPAGRYVLLAVSDTGTGMDSTTLSHVFEPFFTTKGVGKGTGLGLSMVYGVVKQSGGHITVYSELGIGTTFKIYLPRVEEPPEKAQPARQHQAGGTETVLVVEDEEAVRRLSCRSLEANGYKTLPAGGANEALVLCEKHAGEIHLMLTDVVMPQVSGKELAQRAAALRPRMKVLFMSGYTDDAILHHGVLDAGTPFLQKPFTPRSLAQKVREVLDAPARKGG